MENLKGASVFEKPIYNPKLFWKGIVKRVKMCKKGW